MSPRSKENLIKKIKVEHLIQRIDHALEKRDIEHRSVEYAEHHDDLTVSEKAKIKPQKQRSRKNNSSLQNAAQKNKILDAVAKIAILKPAVSAFSVVKSQV